MKISTGALQKIVHEEVNKALLGEKAKTSADARSESLALFVLESGAGGWLGKPGTLYLLLDAGASLKIMEEGLDKMDTNARAGDELIVGFGGDADKILTPFVLGMIKVGKRQGAGNAYGSHEVFLSAAENKVGPLMYDIAMSKVVALTPDRHQVSGTAKKVWTHYFKNRPDVKSMPLDNWDDPKTKTKEDDSQFHGSSRKSPLNQAYSLKSKVATQALENNAAKYLSKAVPLYRRYAPGFSETKIKKLFDRMLEAAAGDFFDKKYF